MKEEILNMFLWYIYTTIHRSEIKYFVKQKS